MIGEVNLIEREINYDKSLKIIDIGWGTIRHAIKLTKRRYNDFEMLVVAEK